MPTHSLPESNPEDILVLYHTSVNLMLHIILICFSASPSLGSRLCLEMEKQESRAVLRARSRAGGLFVQRCCQPLLSRVISGEESKLYNYDPSRKLVIIHVPWQSQNMITHKTKNYEESPRAVQKSSGCIIPQTAIKSGCLKHKAPLIYPSTSLFQATYNMRWGLNSQYHP